MFITYRAIFFFVDQK